jgi:hypothetical protein
MNINILQSGHSIDKGQNIILADGRNCTLNHKIEKQILENNDVIWKIFMKDSTYFIIDNISLSDILLHGNTWYISNTKYIVSRIEGKTINLNQFLLPKNNTKELHNHKDGDNFNFRINNIQLVSQSIVNSKKTKNKPPTPNTTITESTVPTESIEPTEPVSTAPATITTTLESNTTNSEHLFEKVNDIITLFENEYTVINIDILSYPNPYIYLKNNVDGTEVIKIYCNDNKCHFIVDTHSINLVGINELKITDIKWYLHNATGYIYASLPNVNGNQKKITLHSFLYFTANPNIAKIEGYSIHHKNINKLDNRLENLDYVNQSTQNAIRDNPKRITNQPAIKDIKNDLPKLMTYYPPKDNFGEYFEVDIKPRKDTQHPFTRTRKKTTKSTNCTLIDKVCDGILLRYQILHSLITEQKIPLSTFCLEGKQFTGLVEFKKHHEELINSLYNKYPDSDTNSGSSNYTITSFEKYIKEKSKRKANSGSFKPMKAIDSSA